MLPSGCLGAKRLPDCLVEQSQLYSPYPPIGETATTENTAIAFRLTWRLYDARSEYLTTCTRETLRTELGGSFDRGNHVPPTPSMACLCLRSADLRSCE